MGIMAANVFQVFWGQAIDKGRDFGIKWFSLFNFLFSKPCPVTPVGLFQSQAQRTG